jgi:hypothetical protein
MPDRALPSLGDVGALCAEQAHREYELVHTLK